MLLSYTPRIFSSISLLCLFLLILIIWSSFRNKVLKMLKIYNDGSILSFIQYLNTICVPSVSPIVTIGKSKAPGGGNFNFQMSILYRSVKAHSGCIQVSQFIIKGAWLVWLVHSLKSNFKTSIFVWNKLYPWIFPQLWR